MPLRWVLWGCSCMTRKSCSVVKAVAVALFHHKMLLFHSFSSAFDALVVLKKKKERKNCLEVK